MGAALYLWGLIALFAVATIACAIGDYLDDRRRRR